MFRFRGGLTYGNVILVEYQDMGEILSVEVRAKSGEADLGGKATKFVEKGDGSKQEEEKMEENEEQNDGNNGMEEEGKEKHLVIEMLVVTSIENNRRFVTHLFNICKFDIVSILHNLKDLR